MLLVGPPFLCLLTSERGPFRALKMRPVRQEAVLRAFGDAFDVAGAVLRTFEDAFGTPEGRFRYRISLPYRRSLFFTPKPYENASRTPGSLFEHDTHIPYQRSPSPVPNARHRGKLPPQRRCW